MTMPKEAAERLADSFDVDVDENVSADRPSQATQIVDMALNAVSLWHSDEHEPFATMEVNGHQENQPLRSRAFRDFLDYSFYRSHDKAPHSQARQGAIDTLSRDSPDQTNFPGYSSFWDTVKYNPAFQGRQMRPDSLKFPVFI